MTVAVRDVSAVLDVPEGYVDVPAHDVVHPAASVYSFGFEDGTGAFDAGGWSNAVQGSVGHNGSPHAAGPSNTSAVTFAKAVSGLVVGAAYTFSAWAWSFSPVNVSVGVAGIGATAAVATTQSFKKYTYSFTATATSHFLQVTSSGGSNLYFDDVDLTRPQWVEHVPDHVVYSLPLDVTDGSATLDEGWAPYGRAALTIAMPSVPVLDVLDPREDRRVTIVATSSPIGAPATTRTFDLMLRDRVIDHVAGTVKLGLATDEALLQDYANSTTSTLTGALVYQSSVRTIVDSIVLAKIGASLDGDTSTADANFTTLTSVTNMVTNPSAQVDLTDATATGLTSFVRQTGVAWGSHGTVFRLNGSASASDSWLNIGGDTGALRLGMQAGKTYTISGLFHQDTAQAGTAFAARARAIAVVLISPSVGTVVLTSAQAPNTASVTQRLSLTFTVPTDATTACLRFYHGHAGTGALYWTDLMLVEGAGLETDTVTPLGFFDGDSTDMSLYNYQWSGTAGKSTSSRTPVFQRDPQTLWWEPGESAYDFIRPVLEQAGLRLFCDELRQWHLVDSTYSIAGRVTVAEGFNAYAATDTISRDARANDGSPMWFDSVVVKYTWNDTNNVQQIRYDAANDGSPTQTALIEYERPYPGPGAAAYILSRVNGQGRTLDLTAAIDYSATPGMEVVATLPFTEPQTGYTSSVAWDFSEDTMQVGTRGLTDTPANSWFFTSGTWSSQSSTWAAATT